MGLPVGASLLLLKPSWSNGDIRHISSSVSLATRKLLKKCCCQAKLFLFMIVLHVVNIVTKREISIM